MENNMDSLKEGKPLLFNECELNYLSFLIGCHIESMERELDEDNNAFNAMVMAQKIAEIREFKSRIDEYVKGLKWNKEAKNKGEAK